MSKKHVSEGTILTFRGTAEIAWDVGRNIGHRNEEGKESVVNFEIDTGIR